MEAYSIFKRWKSRIVYLDEDLKERENLVEKNESIVYDLLEELWLRSKIIKYCFLQFQL